MIFIEHGELLQGKISALSLKGKLDSETAGDFERFVAELLGKGRTFIIINAEQLEYCSSSGIGLILYLQKKVSSMKGMMVLQGLSPELKTLFTILGFDRLVSLAEGTEEAVTILEKQMQFLDGPSREAGEPRVQEAAVPEEVDVYEVVGEGEETSYPARPAADVEGKRESGEPAPAPARVDAPDFDVPLIVECAECKSFTRVLRSGNYICPECHTEFTVEKDQTIIF